MPKAELKIITGDFNAEVGPPNGRNPASFSERG